MEEKFNILNVNREEKLRQSEKILDLLIECSENIDVVKLRNDDEIEKQGCTALMYAAEFDDVVACRKLLNAGADSTKQVGSAHQDFGNICAES